MIKVKLTSYIKIIFSKYKFIVWKHTFMFVCFENMAVLNLDWGKSLKDMSVLTIKEIET